jgi:TRAP transporter 4TM/12TM fusion protein
VEAAASTGGQIMPPVMGAVAFVMAEMAGIPYATIALAAAIPAVLYYLGVFVMVDLKAKQLGLGGEVVPRAEIVAQLRERAHMLLPLVLLVYLIVEGFSLAYAATASTLAVVLLGMVRRSTRLGLWDLLDALVRTGRSLPLVLLPCAAAGIIVGVVGTTGLGTKISNLLVTVSGENLALALVLTMVGCIIMGMGLPTVTSYIMVAIFMAPALIKMGIPTLPAHLFILYFACLSHVTPPVAVASYAAAGIAGSRPGQTGWVALLLTSAGFLAPFAFIYNPALVLMGSPWEIAWVTITAAAGVYFLGGTIIGTFLVDAYWWERIGGLLAALLLITPEKLTDSVGLLLGITLLLVQWRRVRARAVPQTAAGSVPARQ